MGKEARQLVLAATQGFRAAAAAAAGRAALEDVHARNRSPQAIRPRSSLLQQRCRRHSDLRTCNLSHQLKNRLASLKMLKFLGACIRNIGEMYRYGEQLTGKTFISPQKCSD